MVLQYLDQLKTKKIQDSLHIIKGICSLMATKYIVIRPADKGGGVVIEAKQEYQEENDCQLQDTSTYVKLLGNPTIQLRKELGTKKNILSIKEAKYLIPESYRITVIYTIPKIHKDKENGRNQWD